MCPIDTTMTNDPQCRREKRCCRCGGCIYPPTYYCIRCERRNLCPWQN